MNVPVHPAASIPAAAFVALSSFAVDANGDSGERTLLGALLVMVVLAVVISMGLFISRGDRA
jgi:FtsH-binding integral membrane protein